MSSDEMVFEEIKFREPHRLRRPDRDRLLACMAYEVPAADDLPIFLDRATADAIERHALRDTSVELGGILLGKECVDDDTGEPFVWITKALEAKHYENTQASFTYTHEAWEEITRDRDRLHPDLDIVGWYHTHPDFGIFLSSHDLFIHHHFFAQPLQVAYVVDPIRQTRGFFRWRNGRMEQVSGFHLTADRGDRLALVRLVNDLENITPASEMGAGAGGGGSLSPRLEAELIAMLTRPVSHHQGSSTADRAQLAALFGMIGVAFGVLGLAGILWLNHLQGSVQEQVKAIDGLEKAVRESSDRQRLVLDTVVEGAGDRSAEQLLAQYAKVSRKRDEIEQKLVDKQTNIDVLLTRATTQAAEIAKLTAERDRYKEEAKDAPEIRNLRDRITDLAAENKVQARKIVVLGGETDAGKKTLDLAQSYSTAWYSAVAGWTVSVLLALGMVVGYALLVRPPTDALGHDPNSDEDQPPTHRIV